MVSYWRVSVVLCMDECPWVMLEVLLYYCTVWLGIMGNFFDLVCYESIASWCLVHNIVSLGWSIALCTLFICMFGALFRLYH